ncbi:hypothetical protein RRG08_013607 [Elysia crispata]|uniref:Uncharacterized protein n=1 Tax=Elysia crispata TaxID=231223 RepID=A0AAE1APN9_9GAST|nr:hypothetical protein RRG08_013607 [Elysia crispata]
MFRCRPTDMASFLNERSTFRSATPDDIVSFGPPAQREAFPELFATISFHPPRKSSSRTVDTSRLANRSQGQVPECGDKSSTVRPSNSQWSAPKKLRQSLIDYTSSSGGNRRFPTTWLCVLR